MGEASCPRGSRRYLAAYFVRDTRSVFRKSFVSLFNVQPFPPAGPTLVASGAHCWGIQCGCCGDKPVHGGSWSPVYVCECSTCWYVGISYLTRFPFCPFHPPLTYDMHVHILIDGDNIGICHMHTGSGYQASGRSCLGPRQHYPSNAQEGQGGGAHCEDIRQVSGFANTHYGDKQLIRISCVLWVRSVSMHCLLTTQILMCHFDSLFVRSPLMPEEEAVFTITNGGIADRT